MSDIVFAGSVKIVRRHSGNITIGSVHHHRVLDVERNDIADLLVALQLIKDEVDDARK